MVKLLNINKNDLIEYISAIKKCKNIKNITIKELQGDASTRKYMRINFEYDNTPDSLIAMKLPEPHTGPELPFTNIQEYLKRCKVGVPSIYKYLENRGVMFLEDLGDITFENMVREKDKTTRKEYYRRAIDILIKMQMAGDRKDMEECMAFHYRFDSDTFLKELNIFMENCVTGIFKKKIGNKGKIEKCFTAICRVLVDSEYCFTHRDYHSRNIMIKNNKLRIIDFQDARMGPYLYDIASLLRDSYLILNDDIAEELLDYYIKKKESSQNKKIDHVRFRKVFDYMCTQRNLKAAGTFAYQKLAKNNDRYMQYIPATLNYVRKNLDKYPELSELKRCL